MEDQIVKQLVIAASDVLLDSSDSEDDDVLLNQMMQGLYRNPIVRIQHYVEGLVPCFERREYLYAFRLHRARVEELICRFSASPYSKSEPKQGGGKATLSDDKRILAFLYYVGHEGTCYKDITEKFGIGERSVDSILSTVPVFLQSIAMEEIRWPTDERALSVQRGFSNHGLKNVIGCIDGTHIRIDALGEHREFYRNRKGYFSMQVQAICDDTKKFTDVFIGYPGSVHDARVFRTSSIFEQLPELCTNRGQYLLGDSAYPISTACLTPYKDDGHLQRRHKHYNRCHSSTRVAIENAFGILRQRFRYLFHIKARSVNRIANIIMSCFVLHNIAMDDGTLGELNEDVLGDDDEDDPNDCGNTPDLLPGNNGQAQPGKALRDDLAQQLMGG